MREGEGYNRLWFDQEYVSRELEQFYYYFTIPDDIQANANIYFTVESFYQQYIPIECFDPNDKGLPLVYLKVTNTRTNANSYKYYYEYYHNPLLIDPYSYLPGDTYRIYIDQQWAGSPARDFTVMVYSPIDPAHSWILNEEGYSNMLHMDGTKPTGFIESDYFNGQVHP